MKLLLLSDLHGRTDWMTWASAQKTDALVIAGDLIDAFAPSGVISQRLAFLRWAQSCKTPLVFSSGNHDGNEIGSPYHEEVLDCDSLSESDMEFVRRFSKKERWMDIAARPGVISDGRSEVLRTAGGEIVVTTIPYDFTEEQAFDLLWANGNTLRRKHGLPWMVLHHDPPADTAVGGATGNIALLCQLREYKPDYLVSGHLHEQPYYGSFVDRVGKTICFNPGAPESPKRHKEPNRIELDFAKRTATWFAHQQGKKPMLCQTVSLDILRK